MKTLLILFLISFLSAPALAQKEKARGLKLDSTRKIQIIETACGECQFHLEGKGCDLAVRINGTAYFVDGTDIDSHGDAHAKDGFCNAIRKAKVQGEIVNNRFNATYFKLIAPDDKKEDKKKEKE